MWSVTLSAQNPAPSADQDTLAGDTANVDPPVEVGLDASATDSAIAAIEAAYVDDGLITFDLSSPYHTVLSHLYFLQESSYHPDSAAMTLYVRDPSSEEARKAAIQLKEYFDGSGHYIDLDIIPQNPDYVDSLSHLHKYIPIPEVPEIFVYKRGNSWVYSGSTVRAIPGLHKGLFPFGTLKWLPDWSRAHFLGLELWQFLGILIFVVLIMLLHKVLTWIIGQLLERFLKRIARRNETHDFFYKIARPISLLVLFYILMGLTPVLQLPIGLNKWVFLAFRTMIPVFYMLIALQVVNVIMAYFQRRAEKTESTMDDQLVPLLRNLFKGIVVVSFLIVILGMLKVDVTALVGGVAFGSLALALAAQDTVKNLFGSLLIFVDRPFSIGDWVIIDGNEGVVEEVSVRSTRIRTFANSVITLPNGSIASTAINNMGARAYRRFVTRIGVTYDTPPQLIETFVKGIREIVRKHPATRKDAFEVHFNEMGDFNLQILVYIFFAVPDWSKELSSRQEFLLAIMRLAQTLGINFAFPTQTLHVENFPERKSSSPDYPYSEQEAEAKMQDFLSDFSARMAAQDTTPPEEPIRGSDVESDDGTDGRN